MNAPRNLVPPPFFSFMSNFPLFPVHCLCILFMEVQCTNNGREGGGRLNILAKWIGRVNELIDFSRYSGS